MSSKKSSVAIEDVRDEWVSAQQAAEIIGCDDSRVRVLCAEYQEKKQGLVSYRLGARQWVVSRASAEHFRDNPSSVGRPRRGS